MILGCFFRFVCFCVLSLCFLILETLAFPARWGVIHSSIQNSCKYSNFVSVFKNIKWALNNVKWWQSALQNVNLNFNQCTNCILFNYSINTVWHNTLCIYNIYIWFAVLSLYSVIFIFFKEISLVQVVRRLGVSVSFVNMRIEQLKTCWSRGVRFGFFMCLLSFPHSFTAAKEFGRICWLCKPPQPSVQEVCQEGLWVHPDGCW